MSIVGNMAGCYSPIGKTFIIEDTNGNSMTGVITEQEQVFTATDNDVREGLVYASDDGISTGTKVIPSYHTTEGVKVVMAGSDFTIELPSLDRYDYTKLQVIVCAYNNSLDDSVLVQKVSINDKVYNAGSTDVLAIVTKNSTNKTIELGITNESSSPVVLRYFTYKEIE